MDPGLGKDHPREPRGELRTFDPEYGTVVRRVLPGVVVLMGGCGAVFLWTARSSSGQWLALASFGIGAAFLVLYLWFLVYRRIEFRQEEIVVRRYLFPDHAGRYEDVRGVSTMGFRLDGFPVACHTMTNSAELHDILEELIEEGRIAGDDGASLSRDFRENLSATVKAGFLGAALWLAVDALALMPESVPDGLGSLGVILVTLVVGAPVLKRMSSE